MNVLKSSVYVLCTPDVPSSNSGWEMGSHERRFSQYSEVPPKQAHRYTERLTLNGNIHFQTLDLTQFIRCSADVNMGTISGNDTHQDDIQFLAR
jgi:hypothetical protein